MYVLELLEQFRMQGNMNLKDFWWHCRSTPLLVSVETPLLHEKSQLWKCYRKIQKFHFFVREAKLYFRLFLRLNNNFAIVYLFLSKISWSFFLSETKEDNSTHLLISIKTSILNDIPAAAGGEPKFICLKTKW